MGTQQYTIRRVSPVVDRKLRRIARASNRSLNEVVLEALQIGLGVQPSDSNGQTNDLIGLAAFDKTTKRPSKLDPNKPIRELYRESIAQKHKTS